jgi:hypothetical protein
VGERLPVVLAEEDEPRVGGKGERFFLEAVKGTVHAAIISQKCLIFKG